MAKQLRKGQKNHLNWLNSNFLLENNQKYKAGAIEHQGNLYDLTPLQLAYNLRDEAIDAFNYAQTLIDSLLDKPL